MEEQNAKYPFMISTTFRSNNNGTNWCSILVLHPKKEMLLFESFGFKGLKNFIIQDDKKIINKIFDRLEKFKQADNK